MYHHVKKTFASTNPIPSYRDRPDQLGAITYNTETGQPSGGYRASPSAAELSICLNLKTKLPI